MALGSPAPEVKDTPDPRATYHRAPPAAPETSRVLHLLIALPLLAAAASPFVETKDGPILPVSSPPLDLPIVLVSAATLGILGVVFLAQGLAAVLRALLRLRRAAFRPGSGWAWEWPWDPAGVGDVRAAAMRERWVGVAISLAATAPVGAEFWMCDLHRERAAILMLSAPTAPLLLWALASTAAFLFRRRGALRFQQFPFAVGDRLQGRYLPPPAIARLGPRMKATLRCLETVERPGAGRIVVREAWRWTEDVELVNGSVEVAIDVSAPPGLSTRFGRTAQFWELEVGPRAPGAAENARFIVPVYADPARAARRMSTGGTGRRPASQAPAAEGPARRPGSEVPARKPATNPPAAPAAAPPRRGPSDAPATARRPASSPPAPPPPPEPAATPAGRLSELLPEEGAAPEAPGDERSAFHTPFPPRPSPGQPPEKFRVELFLTPALAVDDLASRIATAFQVELAPLPGAEAGSFFGRADGVSVTLQITAEGRRLLLGGSMPLEPGPGTPSERATDWAIQVLMHAGVAARRPT